MLTAGIYARYSSDRQRATSLEDQVALCQAAAVKFGCVVPDGHVYTDSEISGATEHRPSYARLLEAAKGRVLGAIIIESQDRLWRDQGEMHSALKRLRFWGIHVFSVATGTDLTERTGKLMASVLGWKDEIFLDDLREKTRRGMRGQVSRGLSAGGRAYGYRSEPVRDEHDREIGFRRIIDPAEAEIVNRIFTLYNAGESPKTIAHRLNAEDITPPRRSRGRRLRGWTWTTINGSPKKAIGILNNPLYIGRMVWNRSQKVRDPDTGKRTMRPRPPEEWIWREAPELRIVPQELWESVRARRLGRRATARGNTRGRRPASLLSGLLVCGECGSHFVLRTPAYYGCAAHKDRGPAVCRNGHLARRDRIEQTIVDVVLNKIYGQESVDYFLWRVNQALAESDAQSAALRDRYQEELAAARREVDNVAFAIRQGVLTPTTKQLLEQCEQRVAECEAAVLAMRDEPQRLSALPSMVRQRLENLRGTLRKDVDRARTMLSELIGPVVMRPDGEHLRGRVSWNAEFVLGGVLSKYGAGRGI